MPALIAGKEAPAFTLNDMKGETFSLADALQQGPVVLAFFKITCPVCQYALPYLERLHQAFKGKDEVTIVGVSQNNKSDTALFLREYGITFPILLDDPGKYAVSNAYGLTNVPTTFYVDASGEIRLSSVGWSRADMDQLAVLLADAANTPIHPVFRPGEEVADFRAG
jgi:cytochrome c biogenesis protein CcmG/thiol:disulfide interchange protein DsbE